MPAVSVLSGAVEKLSLREG